MTVEFAWPVVAALLILTGLFYASPYGLSVDESGGDGHKPRKGSSAGQIKTKPNGQTRS